MRANTPPSPGFRPPGTLRVLQGQLLRYYNSSWFLFPSNRARCADCIVMYQGKGSTVVCKGGDPVIGQNERSRAASARSLRIYVATYELAHCRAKIRDGNCKLAARPDCSLLPRAEPIKSSCSESGRTSRGAACEAWLYALRLVASSAYSSTSLTAPCVVWNGLRGRYPGICGARRRREVPPALAKGRRELLAPALMAHCSVQTPRCRPSLRHPTQSAEPGSCANAFGSPGCVFASLRRIASAKETHIRFFFSAAHGGFMAWN